MRTMFRCPECGVEVVSRSSDGKPAACPIHGTPAGGVHAHRAAMGEIGIPGRFPGILVRPIGTTRAPIGAETKVTGRLTVARDTPSTPATLGEFLDNLATQHAAQHGVSYVEALRAVQREWPEAAKAYAAELRG